MPFAVKLFILTMFGWGVGFVVGLLTGSPGIAVVAFLLLVTSNRVNILSKPQSDSKDS
jgi:hypothetical protein